MASSGHFQTVWLVIWLQLAFNEVFIVSWCNICVSCLHDEIFSSLEWWAQFNVSLTKICVLQRRRSPKRTTRTYERPGLSKEEIEEIREAFNLFDTDGSGLFCSSCEAHLMKPQNCLIPMPVQVQLIRVSSSQSCSHSGSKRRTPPSTRWLVTLTKTAVVPLTLKSS